MTTEKTKAVTINEQVIAITQQATKLHKTLDVRPLAESVEGLKSLENSLERISEHLIPFEQRFNNLQALAGRFR